MLKRKLLSRRQFLQLSAGAGAAAVLAACAPAGAPEPEVSKPTEAAQPEASEPTEAAQPEESTKAEPTTEAEPAQSLAELLGPDMPGSPDHAKGWTTTLPDLPAGLPPAGDPVVISVTRRVDAQTKFAEGDSLENNPWSRMIKKLFGVEFEIAWTWATEDEANSKYNLALASGDMPEYMETVPINIFAQMVEAGALEDITEAWDMYASERWKKAFADFGELPWTWSKIDGRIWGIPRVEDLAHNDTILWYRADWLEKLGLKPPATLDELHEVALAIVEAGIGKGASGTTLGLLANKQYAHTWYGSLDPIWGAFGVIPDHWSKEGDGLMLDAMRPAMKEPLALLNQWYQDGIFRKDFFTIETSDSIQDLAASQCGLHFTPSWGANLDAVTNDPETRWAFTNIPAGADGRQARHTENNFRESPFCFRKGAEHIDKIFEITNWMINLTEDYDRRFHGWEGHNYTWEGDTVVATGIGWPAWAIGPIGTRGSGMADPRHIGNEIRYRQQEWSNIAAEDRDAMQTLLLADPTGVQIIGQEARLFILETADLGLINTLWALILPPALPIWNVILLMNFFREIPRELEEAAIIDGASYWDTLRHIYLPLSAPALATLTLFAAVFHWNSWFDGMVLITKNSQYPIMTFLRTVVIDLNLQILSVNIEDIYNLSDRSIRAANIVVATLPILVVYPFLQRYFIHGIRLGAVKG